MYMKQKLRFENFLIYRVCKDTGINRGRLYRWLNKENMSAISCRGVDKVLRYLDKLPENV